MMINKNQKHPASKPESNNVIKIKKMKALYITYSSSWIEDNNDRQQHITSKILDLRI